LVAEKIVSNEQLQAIGTEVRAETEEALAYALAAPYPALGEVGMHVFVEKGA
jgi:TPP-dependent pyruvate/acetoin dehydrogenase alpha subunit